MKLSASLKSDSLPQQVRVILLFGLLAALLPLSIGVFKSLTFNTANLYWLKWAGSRNVDQAYKAIASAKSWGQLNGDAWRQTPIGQRVEQVWTGISKAYATSEITTWRFYQEAQSLESDRQFDAAIKSYHQALASPALQVNAAYSIYRIAEKQGLVTIAEEISQTLAGFSPAYPVAVAGSNEMTLLGYDLNRTELETSGAYNITIYWQTAQPAVPVRSWQAAGWRYIHVGQRLYQTGTASNLLVNGGFEQGLPGVSFMPTGYQNIKYARRNDWNYTRDNFGLYSQSVDGIPSQVVRIANQGKDINGLSAKSFIEIDPGEYYFFSGRIKAEESARGAIGGIWRDQQGQEIRSWYIVRQYSVSDWSTFAGVMQAPEGAKYFNPLVINTGQGSIYLDFLQFFELTIPVEQ